MRPSGFPFAALVGLDTLKLALRLAAVDSRLSVLVLGDKGAGKSTAARGLAALVERSAPFINLPIGATEDRLLGGLDVEKALNGEPALKRGLLAEANGGVLYIDEVNLLPDHLADALLDAVASGTHTVEREGFSATQAADFVMIGSMNPEEGALRPQLLDRFALTVDVVAPMDPVVRAEVLERRLAYDADPDAFCASWAADQAELANVLAYARARAPAVALSRALLEYIATRLVEQGVRSSRGDLAVMRAARALAALEGAPAATASHVDTVLPLALVHRVKDSPRKRHAPPPPPTTSGDQPRQPTGQREDRERIYAPLDVPAPKIVLEHPASHMGTSARSWAAPQSPGVAIGSRPTVAPRELDVRATLRHAVAHTRPAEIQADDLHEKVRRPQAGTRYVFVVDSSGSHAVQDRMRLVKGAVSALLDESHRRQDEVAAIACRGAAAQVLLEPTRSREDAERSLEYLPTGGRTPLAHALELAAGYVNARSVVVLLTDGHANVAGRTGDAWADALDAAGALRCPALVIDTENDRERTGRPAKLAEAMHGRHVHLADLGQTDVVRLLHES